MGKKQLCFVNVETDPRLQYIKKAAYRGNKGIMLNPSATGLILDLIYVINVFYQKCQPKVAADSNSSATLTFFQLQFLFIEIKFKIIS